MYCDQLFLFNPSTTNLFNVFCLVVFFAFYHVKNNSPTLTKLCRSYVYSTSCINLTCTCWFAYTLVPISNVMFLQIEEFCEERPISGYNAILVVILCNSLHMFAMEVQFWPNFADYKMWICVDNHAPPLRPNAHRSLGAHTV